LIYSFASLLSIILQGISPCVICAWQVWFHKDFGPRWLLYIDILWHNMCVSFTCHCTTYRMIGFEGFYINIMMNYELGTEELHGSFIWPQWRVLYFFVNSTLCDLVKKLNWILGLPLEAFWFSLPNLMCYYLNDGPNSLGFLGLPLKTSFIFSM